LSVVDTVYYPQYSRGWKAHLNLFLTYRLEGIADVLVERLRNCKRIRILHGHLKVR